MESSWDKLIEDEGILKSLMNSIPEPTPQKLLKQLLTSVLSLDKDKNAPVEASPGRDVQLLAAPGLGSAEHEQPVASSSSSSSAISDLWRSLRQTARDMRHTARRQYQLLALKVAAALSWQLQLLEQGVPLHLQHSLFLSLLSECDSSSLLTSAAESSHHHHHHHHQQQQQQHQQQQQQQWSLSDVSQHALVDITALAPHAVFAVSVYHRWILWSACSSAMPHKPARTINLPMPSQLSSTDTVEQQLTEATEHLIADQAAVSLQLLLKLVRHLSTTATATATTAAGGATAAGEGEGGEVLVVLPSAGCFGQCVSGGGGGGGGRHQLQLLHCDNSGTAVQQQQLAAPVSCRQFACQLHFELGRYLFWKGEYSESAGHFSECRLLLDKLTPAISATSTSPATPSASTSSPPKLSSTLQQAAAAAGGFVSLCRDQLAGYCRALCHNSAALSPSPPHCPPTDAPLSSSSTSSSSCSADSWQLVRRCVTQLSENCPEAGAAVETAATAGDGGGEQQQQLLQLLAADVCRPRRQLSVWCCDALTVELYELWAQHRTTAHRTTAHHTTAHHTTAHRQQQPSQQRHAPSDSLLLLAAKVDILNCFRRVLDDLSVTVNLVPQLQSQPQLSAFLLKSLSDLVDNILSQHESKSANSSSVHPSFLPTLSRLSVFLRSLCLRSSVLAAATASSAVGSKLLGQLQLSRDQLQLPEQLAAAAGACTSQAAAGDIDERKCAELEVFHDHSIETGRLMRLLRESFDPAVLSDCVNRLSQSVTGAPASFSSSSSSSGCDQLLAAVVDCWPAGKQRHLLTVLLTKCRQALKLKRFDTCRVLLERAVAESVSVGQGHSQGQRDKRGSASALRLLRLIVSREQLLVDLKQQLQLWPRLGDYRELTERVRCCLASVTGSGSSGGGGGGTAAAAAAAAGGADDPPPEPQLVAQCVFHLLNVCQWQQLQLSGGVASCSAGAWHELAQLVASVCRELVTGKLTSGAQQTGMRRVSRDLWNTVVPVFSAQVRQKRSHTGALTTTTATTGAAGGAAGVAGGGGRNRNSPLAGMPLAQLSYFVDNMLEHTGLSVLISLLTRLYNLVRDDSTLELCLEHTTLWPNTLASSTSFSLDHIADCLRLLLARATRLYPSHVSWLLARADLCYAEEDHGSAMRHYLEACLISSDCFSRPVSRTVLGEVVIRRMIRCCNALHCFTQGAVLCQFLDEVDYCTAFQLLAERGGCVDAMDLHYACIWDISLLEFLTSLHHRRGELQKRHLAVALTGQLELNINNNDEIQREAAAARRARFLRALVRQYCVPRVTNVTSVC